MTSETYERRRKSGILKSCTDPEFHPSPRNEEGMDRVEVKVKAKNRGLKEGTNGEICQ